MKLLQCILPLALITSLVSCKKSMTADEINEKLSSGVILISNYYYYSVTLPDGEELFFSGIEDGKLVGLTDDESEAAENCNGCSGTGFFVSDDGMIMTNRHVARPDVSEEDVKAFLKDLKRALKARYSNIMNEAYEKYYESEGNPGAQQQYADVYNSYKQAHENIDDMDMNEADITTHTDIYVVYNGSHITNKDDLHECNTVAISEEESVDLALIQLADEETPEGKYIFHLRENDDEISMDQKLFMIGYNRGTSISKTSEGDIRPQTYSGNVTQKGDGDKILYSIPSQPGSSGSPVINEYGELVAVHYAGWQGTQGFNYGIPTKKVRQFLKEN